MGAPPTRAPSKESKVEQQGRRSDAKEIETTEEDLSAASAFAGLRAPLTSNAALAMQRTAGNQALQRAIHLQREGDEELMNHLNRPVGDAPASLDQAQFNLPGAPMTEKKRDLTDRIKSGAFGAGRRVLSGKGAAVAGVGAGASLGVAGALPATQGSVVNAGTGLGNAMSGRISTDVGAGQGTSVAGGGLGVGLGGLSFGVGAGMLGYGLYKRDQMQKAGNRGGTRLGGRMAKSGGWMMAGGAAGVALGGVELAALKRGSGAGGLNQAAYGLMMAGGAITAARGMWKMGKSLSKLRSLNQVQAVTDEGERWLAKARDREKTKAKVAGLKTVVGGLGIASGGLLMAGNPIGWALGIGAAALGGIGAVIGLRNKSHQAKQNEEDERGHVSDATRQARESLKGQTESQRARTSDPAERKKIKRETGIASAALHSNLEVGKQMHEAAKQGDPALADPVLQMVRPGDEMPFPQTTEFMRVAEPGFQAPQAKDFQALDALRICQALNISPDELKSGGGPELVQAKLAAAEAM